MPMGLFTEKRLIDLIVNTVIGVNLPDGTRDFPAACVRILTRWGTCLFPHARWIITDFGGLPTVACSVNNMNGHV